MAKQVEFREHFYLAPIGRDSSGSSRIRIIGVPLKYDVHYKNGSSFAVNQLSCPASLSNNFHSCLYCDEKTIREDIVNYSRYLCIAWDIPKRRWGALSASLQTFSEIATQLKAKLFTKENILKGETPDILLQSISRGQVSIALIEESLKTKHFEGEMPTHEDLIHYAKNIGGKSLWRFNNYTEIAEKEQEETRIRRRNQMTPERFDALSVFNGPVIPRERDSIQIRPYDFSNMRLHRRLDELENIEHPFKPEIQQDPNFEPPVPKRNKDFWDLI